MKKLNNIILCVLLIIFLSPFLIRGQIVKWIYEDRNANGEWEYVGFWTNAGDKIETVPPWNNIPLSLTNYSGTYSLKLHFMHTRGNGYYCGCSITTSTDGTGRQANDWTDADTGKDISGTDCIEFYVKASNAGGVNTVGIKFEDASGKSTDKVVLNDYITLNDTAWHFVQIPLEDFSWRSGIDNTQLTKIIFNIEQYDPTGDWVLYIDNFKFTNANLTSNPEFKFIYEDAGDVDMRWDYSSIDVNPAGGLIIETNQYKNMPLSTNEKYNGNVSLKVHINKTNAGGWGYFWMSCNSNGFGIPPVSGEDNAPKNISSFFAVNFWIKGDTNTIGRLELNDTDDNSTAKIEITDHVWVTNGWQKVVIPFDDIDWQSFDKTKLKELKYYVETDHDEGEFTCYIDNMAFVTLAEDPGIQPPKVREVSASSIGNNKIKILWKNVPYEDGYRLYRNTVSNQGSAGLIETLSDEVTSYIDNNTSGGVKYYYWVRAFNTHGGGISVWSEAASAVAGTFVKWIYEERNDNGWWEFAWAGTNAGDMIENSANSDGIVDIPTSLTNHSGSRSLKLHYTHNFGPGWCFAAITTSADGTGQEALSWDDVNIGKDIRGADQLEFWVKADSSGVNSTWIEIKDVNDKGTDKVILKDYVTLTNTLWHLVQIPLDDFIWQDDMDKSQIKNINFLAQQYDPSGDWTLYIDELKFTDAGLSPNPKFKVIYDDAGEVDFRWNFSGIWPKPGIGVIFETNEYGNIPVSTNEKYKGNTSLRIKVNKTISDAWGLLWFSCKPDGSGNAPESDPEYNTPKDISTYKYFSFWIKGSNSSVGKLEFIDSQGRNNSGIYIQDYVSVSDTWQQVKISLNDIDWKDHNPRKFKNIQFVIDSDQKIGGQLTGEFTCYIDNMEFTGSGDGVFKTHDFVSNFNAVYMDDHILITWETAASDYIAGYKIYYNFNTPGKTGKGLKPDDSPVFIDGAGISSLKITGFQPKDVIYFAISSVDDNGKETALSDYIRVLCLTERKLAAYPNYLKCEDSKTEIWFNVEKEDNVHVKIYNIAGQLVWEKKEHFSTGLNKVEWLKDNMDGKQVSSGVYIIRVNGGEVDSDTKLILIKCE